MEEKCQIIFRSGTWLQRVNWAEQREVEILILGKRTRRGAQQNSRNAQNAARHRRFSSEYSLVGWKP